MWHVSLRNVICDTVHWPGVTEARIEGHVTCKMFTCKNEENKYKNVKMFTCKMWHVNCDTVKWESLYCTNPEAFSAWRQFHNINSIITWHMTLLHVTFDMWHCDTVTLLHVTCDTETIDIEYFTCDILNCPLTHPWPQDNVWHKAQQTYS